MIIDDILLDIAPEMEDVSSDKRARFISYSKTQVKFCKGDKQKLAIALLAAHQLTLSARRGVPGVITSEREGDLQRGYGGAIGVLAGTRYDSTSYGQEFLRLRRECVFTPMTRQGSGAFIGGGRCGC